MLYYPHYTPSKQRLRSLLLFSDSVSLIVPNDDQAGVNRRRHIEEIVSQNHSLIKMNDPTFRYSSWMDKDGVAQATENLIAELVEKAAQEGDLSPIRFDQHGYVSSGQDDEISKRWTENGWKYVAEEKFPPNFRDVFFSDGMALRVGNFKNPQTGDIVEHNGVLCHPVLADFVLARMAREASRVEGIPSITFGGLNYTNHLYDGAQAQRADRFKLLQSSIDLFIPNNLGTCDIHDFLSIRDEYVDIRRNMWKYLKDISNDMNLDLDVADQAKLLEKLNEARCRISKELDHAKSQIGRERFTGGSLFALEAASTIGLAAVGAALGGPLAAAGTAAVGIAVAQGARKLSTLVSEPNGTVKSIAMSIAKIEKRGIPKRRAVPNYLL